MASRASASVPRLLRQVRTGTQRATLHQTILARSRRTMFAPSTFIRAFHPIPRPTRNTFAKSPKTDAKQSAESGGAKSEGKRPETKQAYYQLSFTCVPCGHRSHHNVSKQGYHHGSTLIACPECRNRHVISDHLGIFGSDKITVEDLMREKGQLVKRGTLGEDGDIEFWPEESYAQQDAGTEKGQGS